MENDFRVSGWAYFVYGAVSLIGFVIAFLFGVTQMPSYIALPFYIHALVNIVLVLNVFVLLSGYYLIKQNTNVHKFAFPIALVLLLSVPVGTVVGFLYLYQRAKNT
ncbi:hypothetical protein [Thalassotalea sediminis]|uniref:hypothetical protein n=1 Tax=Thalassotalea sediminis TaxID=1759089 RepID=UPI002573AE71|nr:hypothetical protein [Thalassotalea sediminis]